MPRYARNGAGERRVDEGVADDANEHPFVALGIEADARDATRRRTESGV